MFYPLVGGHSTEDYIKLTTFIIFLSRNMILTLEITYRTVERVLSSCLASCRNESFLAVTMSPF